MAGNKSKRKAANQSKDLRIRRSQRIPGATAILTATNKSESG
jgi:hypothetical protein